MSRGFTKSLALLVLWGIVAAGFGVSAWIAGGPAAYADDVGRRVVGAVFLAVGVFGTPVLLALTRRRVIDGRVVTDERDDRIGFRATRAGLITVVLYVFLACIALWDRYQPQGVVPAGWMWFLAYSTLILTYLTPAAVSLLLYLGVGSDAEG